MCNILHKVIISWYQNCPLHSIVVPAAGKDDLHEGSIVVDIT